METTTLITLAWELHTQGLSKSCIAERLGKDRGTIRFGQVFAFTAVDIFTPIKS